MYVFFHIYSCLSTLTSTMYVLMTLNVLYFLFSRPLHVVLSLPRILFSQYFYLPQCPHVITLFGETFLPPLVWVPQIPLPSSVYSHCTVTPCLLSSFIVVSPVPVQHLAYGKQLNEWKLLILKYTYNWFQFSLV